MPPPMTMSIFPQTYCTYDPGRLVLMSSFRSALGKAIQCLAKIGDELYIEAESDGVSNLGTESTFALTSTFPHVTQQLQFCALLPRCTSWL